MDTRGARHTTKGARHPTDTIAEPLHRFAFTPGSGATGTVSRAIQTSPPHHGGAVVRTAAAASRRPPAIRWPSWRA